ncbi:MAG: hypothetical protein WBP43_07575, partial [Chitinophagales bacterium]
MRSSHETRTIQKISARLRHPSNPTYKKSAYIQTNPRPACRVLRSFPTHHPHPTLAPFALRAFSRKTHLREKNTPARKIHLRENLKPNSLQILTTFAT